MDPLTDSFGNLHPEYSADGVMTFNARADGNLRRFHVKSDTNLDAVLAAALAMKGD
ncbi:MAG TPA: hypothetical protein VN829_10950 [Dongiaceae bacterium]|nr:hypothetical protein [Dongiaceae bacterium]